jgi:hypothetical protein
MIWQSFSNSFQQTELLEDLLFLKFEAKDPMLATHMIWQSFSNSLRSQTELLEDLAVLFKLPKRLILRN